MENLIAYQKMLELTEYAYVAIRQFPKSEKYGLAADIKHQIYTLLRLMVAANKKYFKKNTLQDMDIEVEFFRSLIRKRIVKRARRSLKLFARLCSEGRVSVSDFRERVMSFVGYARHCDSHVSVKNILNDSVIRRHYKCK
jgi:hypothetical protein